MDIYVWHTWKQKQKKMFVNFVATTWTTNETVLLYGKKTEKKPNYPVEYSTLNWMFPNKTKTVKHTTRKVKVSIRTALFRFALKKNSWAWTLVGIYMQRHVIGYGSVSTREICLYKALLWENCSKLHDIYSECIYKVHHIRTPAFQNHMTSHWIWLHAESRAV